MKGHREVEKNSLCTTVSKKCTLLLKKHFPKYKEKQQNTKEHGKESRFCKWIIYTGSQSSMQSIEYKENNLIIN